MLFHRVRANPRSAFTLVELLVVMSIMVVLATIAVLVVPDALESSRVESGSERVQEWMLVAKQRAMRDREARGIRMYPDASGIVTQLAYVETPQNYKPPGRLSISQARLEVTNSDRHEVFLTGAGDIRPFVEPGDWLELTDTGRLYRIVPIDATTGIEYPATGPADTTRFMVVPRVAEATFAPFVAYNVGSQNGFSFVRRPKEMMGEDLLTMPEGVAINLAKSFGVPGDNQIVFSAGGPVQPAQQGRIILWVEDTLPGEDYEPSLIVIYAHTGAIAFHPVGPPGQEFLYTQDGSSGL